MLEYEIIQKYFVLTYKMGISIHLLVFVLMVIVNLHGLKWLEVDIRDVVITICNFRMAKFGQVVMCISDIQMDDLGIFNGERW